MAIKITGFYQLPHQTMPELVDFNEVFDTSFMRKYTRFRTFEKFLQGSRFKIENQRDFEALPEEKMDAWVRKATKFSSWQEMLDTATDKYVMHKDRESIIEQEGFMCALFTRLTGISGGISMGCT